MLVTDYEALHWQLSKHEGVRNKPYLDTVDKITIGIGRNLTDRGLSPDEIDYLFKNDINAAWKECELHIPGFADMSDTRKYAFVDIMFNLGWPRFSAFTDTLAATAAKDWDRVADELADSKWDKQVGARADELQQMIRKG
jgi:lysozyme